MKRLLIILILSIVSTSIFAQDLCKLGVYGYYLDSLTQVTRTQYSNRINSYYSNLESSFDSLPKNDKSKNLEKLKVKLSKKFEVLARISKRHLDKDIFCKVNTSEAKSRLKDMLTDIQQQLYYIRGVQYSKCMKNKDQRLFLSNIFNLPKKHLKDENEIRTEISEKYEDQYLVNGKLCQLDTIVDNFEIFASSAKEEPSEFTTNSEIVNECHRLIDFYNKNQALALSCAKVKVSKI